MMDLSESKLSPFERGERDGLKGERAPEFPTPDSGWDVRLYHRGWQAGAGKRAGGSAASPAPGAEP